MELTKKQVKITKGVAILMMLLLHLFCTKNYIGKFTPLIMVGEVPLIYYLALFGDCCVAIYCFCSGYGLMYSYNKDRVNYSKNNVKRIGKLYLNYWIVFVLFVLCLGPLLGRGADYPGSFKKVILTVSALDPAYNGAWWFVTTYILLVLLSSSINKLVKKFSPFLLIVISFLIYCIAYIQRIKGVIVVDNSILRWIIVQAALFGTSQFPFIVGSIFAEHKWYSRIYKKVQSLKFRNSIGVCIIVAMMVGHGFVETMFVAPFTGITFLLVFNLMTHSTWVDRSLDYISTHSTNMWLVHMFFYMIYFKELVFAPRYPILIFIWLVILCIGSSYLINIFYDSILKVITQWNTQQPIKEIAVKKE